jgi:hypothetical protein
MAERQNLREQLMEIGINGGNYKHVQRIAKHFDKERLMQAEFAA